MRTREQDRDREQTERMGAAFLVALLLHLAALPFVRHLLPAPGEIPPPSTEVEMVKLMPEEWEKNINPGNADPSVRPSVEDAKRAAVRNTTVPEEKKQVEKPEGRPPGQVVYIGPSGDGTAPENARFLAEYNSKVEKETISRYRRADYKNPLPAPSATREMAGSAGDLKAHGLALKIDRPPAPPGRPPEKTAPPASPAADRLVLKIPDLRARPELNLPVDERTAMLMNSRQSEEMKGNSDRFELRLGGKQKISDLVEEEMPPGVAALMPGASKIAPVAGGPFADHVEGIEEGEGTFLNAREYRYANFFNRVKKEVSVRWAPGDELYKRDPSGAIYGQKDRLTVLHVVLDGKGQLQKAEVQQGSGLDFLDEEAIAAFQRASPFPNPPTGLMKDGVISFNFGFYVEFTSASMKMFRYGN